MKFDTEILKMSVLKSLDNHNATYCQSVRDYEHAVKKSEIEWVADHGEEWLFACDSIYQKIATGSPITRSDIPGGYNTRFYDGPNDDRGWRIRKPADKYVAPAHLVDALALLESVTDREVTTSGLKSLGFTQTELREIIRQRP